MSLSVPQKNFGVAATVGFVVVTVAGPLARVVDFAVDLLVVGYFAVDEVPLLVLVAVVVVACFVETLTVEVEEYLVVPFAVLFAAYLVIGPIVVEVDECLEVVLLAVVECLVVGVFAVVVDERLVVVADLLVALVVAGAFSVFFGGLLVVDVEAGVGFLGGDFVVITDPSLACVVFLVVVLAGFLVVFVAELVLGEVDVVVEAGDVP